MNLDSHDALNTKSSRQTSKESNKYNVYSLGKLIGTHDLLGIFIFQVLKLLRY